MEQAMMPESDAPVNVGSRSGGGRDLAGVYIFMTLSSWVNPTCQASVIIRHSAVCIFGSTTKTTNELARRFPVFRVAGFA